MALKSKKVQTLVQLIQTSVWTTARPVCPNRLLCQCSIDGF